MNNFILKNNLLFSILNLIRSALDMSKGDKIFEFLNHSIITPSGEFRRQSNTTVQLEATIWSYKGHKNSGFTEKNSKNPSFLSFDFSVAIVQYNW